MAIGDPEADDTERAIEIVTRIVCEMPEQYVARGRAFRVEFITSGDGQMLGVGGISDPAIMNRG